MNSTIPTILINVILALTTTLLLFISYRKSKVIKDLIKILRRYRDRTFPSQEKPLSATERPEGLVTALDEFLNSMQSEHNTLIAANTQLRASNKVLAYSKNKFESILDALPDGVVILDMSGNAIMANQAVAIHLGLDREKILHRPPYEWMGYEDWNRLSSSSGATERYIDLSRAGPHIKKTLRATLKYLGKTDHHSGQVVLIRDITEQVLADQARGEFIAHVAHELKAPLNTLKSYSEMLMDGEANDEATKREFFNIINEEADRLGGLVGNLLSITKIEMGSLQIQRNRVKTKEFLENIFHIAEAQKQGQKISMHLLLPDKLPAIKADKDLLSVALLNLISNAMKYTEKGGTVSLKAEEREDTLMISVIDTGIGISASDLPHIFEKFYRSQDRQVRERPGHGLGLALTQQIVHLHDGEIQVNSRPGEGTQFMVSLKKAEDTLE